MNKQKARRRAKNRTPALVWGLAAAGALLGAIWVEDALDARMR